MQIGIISQVIFIILETKYVGYIMHTSDAVSLGGLFFLILIGYLRAGIWGALVMALVYGMIFMAMMGI
ncbi:MAG: hypothetical protein WC346_17485 [Methanogenium sp.]|jgi:hypothetical protein